MNVFDFYTHEKIDDRFYVVTENYKGHSIFKIYVLIGDDKVAVIDSGLGGVNGLRRYIEVNITDKPMITLLTHTHPDHVGGSTLFDEVYFSTKELPGLEWNVDFERRFSDLEYFSGNNAEVIAFCRENCVTKLMDAESFIPLEDGDTVDLGGIVLDVINVPGHSDGSLCFIDRAKGRAFTGDAISGGGSSVKSRENAEFTLKHIERFIELTPGITELWGGHERQVNPMQLAIDKRECLLHILNGVNLENDVPAEPPKFKGKPSSQPPRPEKRMTHYHGIAKTTYNAYDFE